MKVLGFTFGDALRGYDLHLVNNRNVFAGYVQTLDYFKVKRSELIGSIDSFKDYFKTIDSSHDAINSWKHNTKHKPGYIASKIKYYYEKLSTEAVS